MSETRRPDLEHQVSESAATARRKVSREGVVLLKSFEGFRARAEREGDGWVIGYGHRRSAREGLTIGEADAELLLQYDLMPVVQALNALPVALNAHQFDALASFTFSVGVERFRASDVHARLAEGRPDAAAEALLAWSEPAPAVAGLRRRAAERALFLADPQRPVALAELLAAPLPTLPEPAPVPVAEARAAAVAALLGEPPALVASGPGSDPVSDPTVVVPSFTGAETVVAPAADEKHDHSEPLVTSQPPAAPRAVPQFAAPYGPAIIGPLPGFPTARPAPTPAPDPAPTPSTPAPLPLVEVIVQPEAASVATTVPAIDAPWPTAAASSFPPAPAEPLILTPAPEAETPTPRPVWDEAARAAETPAPDQDALFVETPSQTSILRHEEEPAGPRRFDWSETGMYVIMGGLGLVSCAVSAAAFRVAVEDPSPMGETTAVAWTLAVIGAVCVGAASRHFWIRATRRQD